MTNKEMNEKFFEALIGKPNALAFEPKMVFSIHVPSHLPSIMNIPIEAAIIMIIDFSGRG